MELRALRPRLSEILWRVLPLAHAGHWILWTLYLPPLAIVIGSIAKSKLSERRERRPGRR
jgi:hypothetical protein